MDNSEAVKANPLCELLIELAENNRADLNQLYIQALRETIFTNRSEMRPRQLASLASDEVEALLSFFRHTPPSADERGMQLSCAGLSEQSVLRLGEVLRQFFLTHVPGEQIIPAMAALVPYQNAQMLGFLRGRTEIILSEQERIRSALQVAVGHYTVEIKEIQAMAERASDANKFKSQFIARISHELRTPLGALMGMAEMLHLDIYGPLTPQQDQIALRIVANAQELKQTFVELLDQAQIESGQLRLKKEEFSPASMVEAVNSNYLAMALQKGLSMRAETGSNLPATLLGDRARIEQILSNLVVNAIKFTNTGGIRILIDRESDTHWFFQVKDTGIGIAREDMSQIFEPFHQVDESVGHKLGGVGLGLSIVQQLVASMHGAISVDSKPGQGSTFKVVLPLIPE